jgi:predicted ATP-dependent endonuclease of OLD family
MARLIIKNIGPIKHVDIELNKINVIIGEQSSGKSTICKIASFCTWVEKTVSLEQETFPITKTFKEKLETFHKLQGYFNDNSEITYTSDIISIHYKYSTLIEFNNVGRWSFKRPKIEYIPAERNIPNWFSVRLQDNNILSFMTDWGDSRLIYTKDNSLPILNLDAAYYYDESKQEDFIRMQNGKTIKLAVASSGLQSAIPLLALFTAYTERMLDITQLSSYQDRIQTNQIIEKVSNQIRYKTARRKDESNPAQLPEFETLQYENVSFKIKPGTAAETTQLLDNFVKTQYVSFFIEEPELNLFPATQRNLTYQLVKGALKGENKLFITTHSQYILYALNNCMMGHIVKDKIPAADKEKVTCKDAWVNPEDVSVWKITDGSICSIQEEDGLIGSNYFDDTMQEIMDDFYVMLNYYGDDQN